MSVECGLFKPNVPLRWAMKMVCEKLRVQNQQEPCLMPAQNMPDSELCLHVQRKQRSTEELFDVFLCHRNEGVDRAVAERLNHKLTSCHVETEGFEQGPLQVFLKAGVRVAPCRQCFGACGTCQDFLQWQMMGAFQTAKDICYEQSA